jgi:hypothetical protein
VHCCKMSVRPLHQILSSDLKSNRHSSDRPSTLCSRYAFLRSKSALREGNVRPGTRTESAAKAGDLYSETGTDLTEELTRG